MKKLKENVEKKALIPESAHIMRVLIVDDDLVSAQILAKMFPELYCRVDFAFDGITALIQISKCPYDLVLLDWRMPYFDGDRVIERIEALAQKGHFKFHNEKTQVLVYSGENESGIRIPKIKSLEYLGFLSKMLPLSERYQVIRNVVRNVIETRST